MLRCFSDKTQIKSFLFISICVLNSSENKTNQILEINAVLDLNTKKRYKGTLKMYFFSELNKKLMREGFYGMKMKTFKILNFSLLPSSSSALPCSGLPAGHRTAPLSFIMTHHNTSRLYWDGRKSLRPVRRPGRDPGHHAVKKTLTGVSDKEGGAS